MCKSLILLVFLTHDLCLNAQLPDSLKQPSWGTLSLRAQHLFMGRDHRGDSVYAGLSGFDEHAHSVALTMGFETPVVRHFQAGAGCVFAEGFLGGGSYSGSEEDHLANGSMQVLDKLYLRYYFRLYGKRSASFTAGRQPLETGFSQRYNIRQRDQAFEAVVLQLPFGKYWGMAAGHVQRFLGWRHSDRFMPMADLEGLAYDVPGMQFAEVCYDHMEYGNTRLRVYNFYGHNLYNTTGAHYDHRFAPARYWTAVLKLRAVHQENVGRYGKGEGQGPGRINANAFQGGLCLRHRDFSLEPGVQVMTGNNEGHTLHIPFQAALASAEPLYEIDMGRAGGSRSLYVHGRIEGQWDHFQVLYFQCSQHTAPGRVRELDLIYTHTFLSGVYVSFKLGSAEYDFGQGGRNRVVDYRLFTGFSF